MTIRLHADTTDEGMSMWWSESPEVPGFSAAEVDLAQLRIQTEAALREILATDSIDFTYEVVAGTDAHRIVPG